MLQSEIFFIVYAYIILTFFAQHTKYWCINKPFVVAHVFSGENSKDIAQLQLYRELQQNCIRQDWYAIADIIEFIVLHL